MGILMTDLALTSAKAKSDLFKILARSKKPPEQAVF
jgi:hypothetical protein